MRSFCFLVLDGLRRAARSWWLNLLVLGLLAYDMIVREHAGDLFLSSLTAAAVWICSDVYRDRKRQKQKQKQKQKRPR